MARIVLTDDQASAVAGAGRPVRVYDAKGNVLGFITPTWTEENITDAKRRLSSRSPRLTTAEIQAYLRSLES